MLVRGRVAAGAAAWERENAMSDYNVNLLVGFGSVLLLGLVGFLYAWFSYNKRDREAAKRTGGR